MANIAISNLYLTGSDLFMDSESFFNDLIDEELITTNGGLSPVVIYTVAVNSWWFVGGAAVGAGAAVAEAV